MAVPAFKKDRVITLEGLETYNDYIQNQFDQTVTGLFKNGRVITYVTGDGVRHSFINEDDSIYSLGTDTTTGLTKIYKTAGNNEDGTMSQKAITEELLKKTEVSLGDDKHTLIFTNTTPEI